MRRLQISRAFCAIIIVAALAGCGGGGSVQSLSTATSPPGATATPAATPNPSSAGMTSVPSNAGTQISLPGANYTLLLYTSASWPSGVAAKASAVTSGAPAPQYTKRARKTVTALATYLLTFSGVTGTGNLSTSPIVCCGNIVNGVDPTTLVAELFDATAGGPPLTLFYSTGQEQFIAIGSTFQIQLGDTYYLEVVSGHGQTGFGYTGTSQSFVVPANVAALTIAAAGASSGGMGGVTAATLPVTPGSTLDIEVGGAANFSAITIGGYNGGANGGSGGAFPSYGGGGASDVRVGGNALSDRVLVAGGGGGNGAGNGGGTGGTGGVGGGLIGGAGGGIGSSSTSVLGSGAGGTQSVGGAGGAACYFTATSGTGGQAGIGGAGGNGAGLAGYGGSGGGGGGGLFGGGGGGGNDGQNSPQPCGQAQPGGAGGGGGSSFVESAAINVTLEQGDGGSTADFFLTCNAARVYTNNNGSNSNGCVTILW